jgi:hypothetical protein
MELPFDIVGDDDITSQLSSQYSSSAKSSDAPGKLTIKNQMIHINQSQAAENMFCLEFDFDDLPQEQSKRFKKVD